MIEINLKSLNIPFASPNPAKAKFSLGSKLGHTKVKINAEYQTKTIKLISLTKSMIYRKYCLKTNHCGDFKMEIPAYTIYIKLSITIYTDPKVKITQIYRKEKIHHLESSYDGNGNNLANPSWGMYQNELLRKCPSDYADAKQALAWRAPSDQPNPNPRHISNVICKNTYSSNKEDSQDSSKEDSNNSKEDNKNNIESTYQPNSNKLNNLCWMWGQFLDHELDLTTEIEPAEYANITTPADDKYPDMTIIFKRSIYKNNNDGVRQQLNMISSYIDGSVVYGDDSIRAYALRKLDGSGQLKTSTSKNAEILANYNLDNLPNASLPGQKYDQLFLLGDIRGNENVALTAMQTLFVREHNRLCAQIVTNKPELQGLDEIIYQQARKIVKGIIQHITYYEFLPALLGTNCLPDYTHYDNKIKADIASEFSTVGFRVGHSMLPNFITVADTKLELKQAFFRPNYVYEQGIDNILKGASQQVMKEINNEVVDDIRDFLFGTPENGYLLDLVSLNIQRGRDHGIPGYNEVRSAYGLEPKSNFGDITSNSELATKLSMIYESPDYIDPWVGMLCEDHYQDAAVGELTYYIMVEQFIRLRAGDRFWYLNDTDIDDLELICYSGLTDVINRNTDCEVDNINIFKVNN